MALTLLAKRSRLSCVAAAFEKLSVSPQPPIATMIVVLSANLGRTEATVVKRGQWVGLFSLKTDAGMNARVTCVMADTRDSSGTTLCWLQQSHEYSGGYCWHSLTNLPSQVHHISWRAAQTQPQGAGMKARCWSMMKSTAAGGTFH